MIPQVLSTLSFEIESLTGLDLTNLAALAASFPSPPAPCLYVGSGSQIQVLTLSQQPLYRLDSLPSPLLALLKLKESRGSFSSGRRDLTRGSKRSNRGKGKRSHNGK